MTLRELLPVLPEEFVLLRKEVIFEQEHYHTMEIDQQDRLDIAFLDTIGNMAHILSIKGYAEFFKCDLNASGDDDLDDYLRLHDLTCVIFCL